MLLDLGIPEPLHRNVQWLENIAVSNNDPPFSERSGYYYAGVSSAAYRY
jgi:hypothetical protein